MHRLHPGHRDRQALLDQATSKDLATFSRELAARRRDLSELLERYRKNPTPELKAQITQLLDRLKTYAKRVRSAK